MSEANLETLSAAMDGDLSSEELRFLLRRLDHDAPLLQAWSRYHVAGDSLRRQLPAVAATDFAARVMQAIDGEVVHAHIAPKRRDWLRLSVGGAIAASVAVGALMVSQPTAPGIGTSAPLAATNSVASRGSSAPTVSLTQNTPATSATNDVLASVPQSLSPYSASALSQRASVTLGDPSENPLFQRYPSQSYSIKGYKALNNRDGSYLLLIDTPPSKAASAQDARQ